MPLDPILAPPRSTLRGLVRRSYRPPEEDDTDLRPQPRLGLLAAVLASSVLWALLYRLGRWIVEAL